MLVLLSLFCCAGMNISVQLFAVKWKMILGSMVVLIAGKLAVMVAAGQMFGLSRMASLRAGRATQDNRHTHNPGVHALSACMLT